MSNKKKKEAMEEYFDQIRSGNINTNTIDFLSLDGENENNYNSSYTNNNSMNQFFDQIRSGNIDVNKIDFGDSTNIKNNEEKDTSGWFKKSNLFDDDKGNLITDTLETGVSTLGDMGTGLVKGIMNIGEGIGDLITYGRAEYNEKNGNIEKADELRKIAQRDSVEEIFDPIQTKIDENSILGDKSDNIVEGLGYVAGMTAIGVVSGGAATLATTATTFTSAMGQGINQAYEEGANNDDAWKFGIISGLAEAGSEMLFGGLGKTSGALGFSKGITSIDDALATKVSGVFKSTIGKNLSEYVIKAGAEGTEEVISGFIQALGQKITYKSEKDIGKIIKDQNLLEQFVGGALTSAIAQVPGQNGIYKTTKQNRDFITGLTKNESKVYDSELSSRVQENTKNKAIENTYNEQLRMQENLGIKLSEEDKATIKQAVIDSYDRGRIENNTKLNSKEYSELEEKVRTDLEEGNISTEKLKSVLGEDIDTSKDKYIQKSYYEEEQKYNSFEVKKTNNEKVNILYQSAADSGMNNTSKTRKKVELISKLTQDTDRQYKFVSPEQLKEMGYNENANGLIDKSTGSILINAHSEKGLQAIVGHETTHIFDSTDNKGTYTKEYQALQDAAIEYAKTKGIYEDKIKSITSAYGDILSNETQTKEELTADLVGDFLFNDEKFIENLSTKNRNIFQKIYDYVKHAYKMAISGSDEAKSLENLKYKFDNVYKTISEETNNDIKYTFAGKQAIENMKDNKQLYNDGISSYTNAIQLAEKNVDNEEIRKQTGWFRDKNKDWKFEFSDKDMSLKDNIKLNKKGTYKLGDILEHDALFTAYPELKGYIVETNKDIKGYGKYNNNKIELNSDKLKSKNAIELTLVHEIQHAIQDIEKFETGMSMSISKEGYYKSLGENEAKDVEKRLMLEKKKKDVSNIPPESSKKNPINPKLENYLKNRGIIDKIKDGIYNHFNNKFRGDSYEKDLELYNEEDSESVFQDNKESSTRQFNGSLGRDKNIGKEQFRTNKLGKIEESENTSGSFNLSQNDIMKKYVINKEFRISDSYKIYRGISEDGNNTGTALYGEGLYTTTNKKYASQFGKVVEIDRNKLPQNPIQFKTETDFSQWEKELANMLGVKKNELYNNDNVDKYVKRLGYDGITIGSGRDMTIVTFSDIKNSLDNDSYITGDDIAVKDLLKQEKANKEIDNSINTLQNKEQEFKENNNINSKELADKYKQMEIGKREYEKILRSFKSTEKEKITVDRLIKGEIDNSEIPNSVDKQRVVDLYNAKAKYYNIEKEIKNNRKDVINNYRKLAKSMTQNIENWKDKKFGLQYQVNTMKRNLRDIIPNKQEAESVYNEYFKPITINNANIEKEINKYNERISKYNINNIESQYIQMIGENKYNPDTKLPYEEIQKFYEKNKSKIDTDKCNNAVNEFREIYDELLIKINDTLLENGYKPIEYRAGYFPHFIEEKSNTIIGKMAEKLGWKINKDALPTDISGITEQFKPGKRWTTFSQQRKGDETDYNALKGYDNYIRGAMDVIYHTKDIQKLRALENEIRYQYSDTGIQEQINEIYNNQDLDAEAKTTRIDEIIDNVKNNPMGNLVTELRNYTNNLANKKSSSDRNMEQTFGRQTYSIMSNIQNRVSANMVGANISSAITNFIPITQAWSQTSTKNLMKSIRDGIAVQFKDDGFSNNSVLLTNRNKQADRLYKTGLENVNDKLGYMFNIVDNFTSNVIVRAKYYDNIEAGLDTKQAIDNADEFAKDVMAGRSKGDQPTIFYKKNPIVKLFTAFQLEVNNQYGYMFKDITTDLGGEAKEKLVGAFVKMFLGAFLYNLLSEKITGRKSAFSPIDLALDSYETLNNKEMNIGDKANAISTDIVGELPFIGGIAGGGRLPIQGAIPYDNPFSMISETISNAGNLIDGNNSEKQQAIKSLQKEWSKPLYYVALPFAGGQIKKTSEGLGMYNPTVDIPYYGKGNIDLNNRKVVDNGDGSFSTEISFSFEDKDGKEVLIPTVVNGKEVSQEEAIEHYKKTGEYLGKFNSPEKADEYAQALHERQEKYYSGEIEHEKLSGSYTDKGDLRYTVDEDVGSKVKAALFGAYANPYASDYIDSGYKTIDKKNINEMVGLDMNSTEYRDFREGLNASDKTEDKLNYINSQDLTPEQKNIAANNINKNSKKTIDMSKYNNYDSYDEYKYARDNPEKYSVISQITNYDNYNNYKDEISEISKKYKELGEDVSNSKQKTAISKQKKQEIQKYINSLDLDVPQKMMLEKEAGGYSIKNYKNTIKQYLDASDLTNSEKYTIWDELFN